jgi:hypothetical protein
MNDIEVLNGEDHMRVPLVTRRAVLRMAGVGMVATLGSRVPRAEEKVRSIYPDTVVLNAKIYTVEPGAQRVEAFAVKDGRFVAVGTTEDVRALVGKGTKVFDAHQMTVVPGFIDCHNHAVGDQLLYEVIVGNPFEVEFVTIDSIVDKLRAKDPAGILGRRILL